MRIYLDEDDRLVLSGPPTGRGAVILILVVGTAMSAGGALFLRIGLTNQELAATILGGLVGAVGLGILLGGVGVAPTTDRLELNRVTNRGYWTRRLCGRFIKPPVEFEFNNARHVTIDYFTETSPRTDGGTSSVEKVRACLLITKPRRRIVLDEAERQRVSRVLAVAESAATVLGLRVEGPGD